MYLTLVLQRVGVVDTCLAGYGVLIQSVRYKGAELLHLGEHGEKLGGVLGVFDTGSTCIEMPRGLFGGKGSVILG